MLTTGAVCAIPRRALKSREPPSSQSRRPLRRKQAQVVIHNGGQAGLSDTDQSEAGPKLSFDKALIVEQHRERRTGNRGDGIQEAQPRPERHANEMFRSNRPSNPRGLNEDQRKKKRVRDKFDPARMERGEKITADGDARQ